MMLVWSRVVLAPVGIGLVYFQCAGWLWLSQFIFAALSDWLDGKLARRWGCITPRLRQADSMADMAYGVSLLISLWISHPEVVREFRWGISAVLLLELGRIPLDWILFRKVASYHAVSAKLFGFSLLVTLPAIIVLGYTGPAIWGCLALGIASEVEGIAISFTLPKWTHDVKNLAAAIRIRKNHESPTG